MSSVKKLNQAEFENEVLRSELPVVVDFYADWCPPCRALAPMLERLAVEFDGRIKFVKVNSDEESALANSYQVTGLPTVLMFENGQLVGQFSGLPQEEAFQRELERWLKDQQVVN